MKIDQKRAFKIFKELFNNQKEVIDFAGRKIHMGHYNSKKTDLGWNVDHILPKSLDGKDDISNLQICHVKTNSEKSDHFPYFPANGNVWKAVKENMKWSILKQENISIEEIEELNRQEKLKSTAPSKTHKETNEIINLLGNFQNKKIKRLKIYIDFQDIEDKSIFNILKELFLNAEINIVYNDKDNFEIEKGIRVYITKEIMNKNQDILELMQKSIELNTYLSYFYKKLYENMNYFILISLEEFDLENNNKKIKENDFNTKINSLKSPMLYLEKSIINEVGLLLNINTTIKSDVVEYNLIKSDLIKPINERIEKLREKND